MPTTGPGWTSCFAQRALFACVSGCASLCIGCAAWVPAKNTADNKEIKQASSSPVTTTVSAEDDGQHQASTSVAAPLTVENQSTSRFVSLPVPPDRSRQYQLTSIPPPRRDRVTTAAELSTAVEVTGPEQSLVIARAADDKLPPPPLDSIYAAPPSAPAIQQWTELVRIENDASRVAIFNGERQANVIVSAADIVASLLRNSFRVQQLQVLPTISRQEINEEYGKFDTAAFVSSAFDVQNLQQKTENNDVRVGIRKQTATGGAIELSQSLGVQDNAIGINALDQGTSSLNVIVSQEVLRDAGRVVVLSRGLTASYRYEQQQAQSVAEANQLVEEALRAYWELYRARARFFVQLALVEWASRLTEQIEERSRIVERATNSLEQARALALEAKAELIDTQTRVLQAQDALYRLLNDPAYDPFLVEIITADSPASMQEPLMPVSELSVAMASRPELLQKLSDIRVAAVERQVALNQLLPKLALSLRSSLNGFDDGRDFGGALGIQDERPASAAAGATFEFFTTNRAAKARSKRTELGLVRAQLDYEDQIQQIRQEVLTSIRVVNNASPKIELRLKTLEARQREIDAIAYRTWINPEEGASVVGQLEQLFQSINRLVRTQQDVIDAKIELQTSVVSLLRAKGVLVAGNYIAADIDLPQGLQTSRERIQQRGILHSEINRRVIAEPVN